jgi:phage gpG-like protein
MKNLIDLINDIRAKSAAIKHLKEAMPRIIGVESVRLIKENFKKQGYDSGSGLTPWDKRKDATNKMYDYNRTASYRTPKLGKKSKYKNPYKGSVVSSKRPILTQTGNLRDSITFQASGKTVLIGVYPKIVSIGGKTKDALAYAKHLNEGGPGKWGKNTTKVPKRQYMPRPSDGPNNKIIAAINKKRDFEIDKILAEWRK